jgi:hypothetical protein
MHATTVASRREGGFGAWMSYDPTRVLGVDAEVSYFPDRRTSLGLFGVRIGYRSDRIGVYAKVRPGYYRTGVAFDPTVYTVDAGGVMEIYAWRRVTIRVDVGDTITDRTSPGGVDHRFQVSTGVGIRF